LLKLKSNLERFLKEVIEFATSWHPLSPMLLPLRPILSIFLIDSNASNILSHPLLVIPHPVKSMFVSASRGDSVVMSSISETSAILFLDMFNSFNRG
jgi:hypothetical protein